MGPLTEAVRVFLISEKGIFFALRPQGREDNLFGNKPRWVVPGGKVRLNETPEETLSITTKLMLGITIKQENLTPLYCDNDSLSNARWTVYTCTQWDGEFSAERLSGFEKTEWVNRDNLRQFRSANERIGTFLEEAAQLYFSKV